MKLISRDLDTKTCCYKLTKDEIVLYRFMETLSYDYSTKVETDLVGDVLTVIGGFMIQSMVIVYFDQLSRSSEYKLWLRKHKLNGICLKLVK